MGYYDRLSGQELRDLTNEKTSGYGYIRPWEQEMLVQAICESNDLEENEKLQLCEKFNARNGIIRYDLRKGTVDYVSLRQSLYNILDMQNRGVDTVVVGKNVSGYKNLIRDAYVYAKLRKVVHTVNDSELGNYETEQRVYYLKLTPLGKKIAKGLADRALTIANKELSRLKQLGIA